ncbi:anthranilate synthase component I family protein [Cryobacterium sp. 1639]|nr:anthranilate synthase component I family protein [Cryobacterium sp. 1639]
MRRIPLPGWVDPAAAYAELYAGSRYAVWLDAGADATTGLSYLAGAHTNSTVITADAGLGTVTRSRPLDPDDLPHTTSQSVFDLLRAELVHPPMTDGDDSVGFRLGWVGWLGYDVAQPVAPATSGSAGTFGSSATTDPTDPVGAVPGAPSLRTGTPDAALLRVDRAIVFDHSARTVTILARQDAPEPGADPAAGVADLETWIADTSRRLAGLLHATSTAAPAPVLSQDVSATLVHTGAEVRWRHDADRYARLIELCQERIAAGDAYQLCLTNEVTISGRFDADEVYRHLRATSATHHGGLLRFGEHALLSASPEEFLAVSPAGRVRTRPIKGTRPRSSDPDRDRMLRAELLASEKERAENLMIVDLMRNDLGRIAALGTVAVTGLLQTESYPHVHQLVSTVEARLAPGLTAVDAVQAAFPAGSMTGAPKASAMGILRALEGGERGVYAGAFGYLGDDGALDLAMVIRSIVLGPDGASIGTGGGITALSVPAEEIEETRIKADALIGAVLAAARATGATPDLAGSQGLVT